MGFLDACQQLGLAAGHGLDVGIAEKAAIPHQEHVRAEIAASRYSRMITDSARRIGLTKHFHENVGADLAQGQHAGLREGPRRPPALGATKDTDIVGCVGQVDYEAIEGHQSQVSMKSAGRVRAGQ